MIYREAEEESKGISRVILEGSPTTLSRKSEAQLSQRRSEAGISGMPNSETVS